MCFDNLASVRIADQTQLLIQNSGRGKVPNTSNWKTFGGLILPNNIPQTEFMRKKRIWRHYRTQRKTRILYRYRAKQKSIGGGICMNCGIYRAMRYGQPTRRIHR